MLGSSHGALAAPTYTTFLSATCSGSYPVWIATGDVNGDGKADIVATINNYHDTGCPMNEVAVFTGLGTGKFGKPVFYSTGASVQSNDVFLADVNGDGQTRHRHFERGRHHQRAAQQGQRHVRHRQPDQQRRRAQSPI